MECAPAPGSGVAPRWLVRWFLPSSGISGTTGDLSARVPIARPPEPPSSAVDPRGDPLSKCRSAQAGGALVWSTLPPSRSRPGGSCLDSVRWTLGAFRTPFKLNTVELAVNYVWDRAFRILPPLRRGETGGFLGAAIPEISAGNSPPLPPHWGRFFRRSAQVKSRERGTSTGRRTEFIPLSSPAGTVENGIPAPFPFNATHSCRAPTARRHGNGMNSVLRSPAGRAASIRS